MSISQTTIGEATSATWALLWRASIWGICVGATSWAVGVEWSWRLGLVCIVSSTVGEVLNRVGSETERGK